MLELEAIGRKKQRPSTATVERREKDEKIIQRSKWQNN